MVQIILGPTQLTALVEKANQSGQFHRLLITLDDNHKVEASAINSDLEVINYGGALTIPGCPYPPDCVTIKIHEKNNLADLHKCVLALKELEQKNNVM